jgi:hypothetical protein
VLLAVLSWRRFRYKFPSNVMLVSIHFMFFSC